jgi:CRP-like cAMP-binding protein
VPREVYVRYGAPLPGFCFVESGLVVLWLGRGKAKRVFRVVGPGESFCEAPALARAPSPFEVVAQKPSRVLALPAADIEALAARNRGFNRALIALLAERVMLALGDLDASTMPATERVCAYLASSAQRTASGTWQASLPVTKTVLAARLGVRKETLSRTLRSLADRGVIEIDGRRLTIRDPKRLGLNLRHAAA